MYILKQIDAVNTALLNGNTELAVKFNIIVGLTEDEDPMNLANFQDVDMPVVTSANPAEGWGALLTRGQLNAEAYVTEKYNSVAEV